MEEVLSAEHCTYKFKMSTKPWHPLCCTNSKNSEIAEIVVDCVQNIIESSNDTRVQRITPNVKRAMSDICENSYQYI